MPTDPADPDTVKPHNYLRTDPALPPPALGGWTEPRAAEPATYDERPVAVDRRLHTEGKGRYDLISHAAVRAWALRLEHGAAKYPDRDWQHLKSPAAQAVLWDKAFRHLHQAAAGQTDEDHLAAALTNIGFLIDLRDRANPVDEVSGPRAGG